MCACVRLCVCACICVANVTSTLSRLTDSNETSPLPILMFVESETYETGSGNAYDGSVLAAFGHVIVVTINYRLGVLGKSPEVTLISAFGAHARLLYFRSTFRLSVSAVPKFTLCTSFIFQFVTFKISL